MNKSNQLSKDSELLVIRRAFHAAPELSGKEFETARKVASILSNFHPSKIIEQVGGTGVIAIFDSGQPGKTVLFRAELDALPIQEVNDFPHRSRFNKVAHKCGHDGHLTILLGLAQKLSQQGIRSGKVVLLFQPAEENGRGAKAVLEDVKFKNIQPDFVFAIHNLPGYPLNHVVLKKDSFTAAVKSIIIKLYGKTAHAAEPENGVNPAMAIAEILSESDILSNNQADRKDFRVITPIHIEMGKIAYGVAAGYGELRLTIRTWTETQMESLVQLLTEMIERVTSKHHLKTKLAWTNEFATNKNDEEAVDLISASAQQLQIPVIERPHAFKWGEDFGLFTQKFRGAMFGIGAGENTPALHNPDYDFPDEMLPLGVDLFYTIATKILS